MVGPYLFCISGRNSVPQTMVRSCHLSFRVTIKLKYQKKSTTVTSKRIAARPAQKSECSCFLNRLSARIKIPARIATTKLAKGRIPSVPTGVGGGATIVATTAITPAAIWVSIVQFLRIADRGLSSISAKECELLMAPQGHIPGFDLLESLVSMISDQSRDFLPT